MIGWPLSRPCAVACLFGDESQQPIFPHVMHMRRCTQPLPIFKHSSQPSIFSGSAVSSIWSRWLQIGELADTSHVLSVGKHKGDRKVTRMIGPPRLDPQPGPAGLELELFAAELRADLDSERLALLEGQVDLETLDRDAVRLPRAEADVHPLVLRIPARLVHEALLVERRVELALEVTDDRMDEDPRIRGRDRLRARSQGLRAHVERNEALDVERIQENTGVPCAAGAELDERARLSAPCDRARPGAEDLALPPRKVVLRKPGDLLVQP